MSHVVRIPRPAFTALHGALRVFQVPALKDNLVWLVQCAKTGDTWAVDGPGADEALAACETHGLRLVGILNTHTHGDHIGINKALARQGLLDSLQVVGSASRASEIPGLTRPVHDGDTIELGAVRGTVWLTEGHLDGHLSFVFTGPDGSDGVVFCGDTLFTGGCGYLFDGPPETMYRSLQRLASLHGDTRVCCAHEYTEDNLRFAWTVDGQNAALAERIRTVWHLRAEGRCAVPSTIAEECATNPFIRCASADFRASLPASLGRDARDSGEAAFAAVRALKNGGAHKQVDDGQLPL